MNEVNENQPKIDEFGRITNKEDAHLLANLENEARDAGKQRQLADDAMDSLDDPSDAALLYQEAAHFEAEEARFLADAALNNYVEQNK